MRRKKVKIDNRAARALSLHFNHTHTSLITHSLSHSLTDSGLDTGGQPLAVDLSERADVVAQEYCTSKRRCGAATTLLLDLTCIRLYGDTIE